VCVYACAVLSMYTSTYEVRLFKHIYRMVVEVHIVCLHACVCVSMYGGEIAVCVRRNARLSACTDL